MNIRYHAGIGICLDLALDTKGLCTLASILPDLPLVANEVRLFLNNEVFNPWDIPLIEFFVYLCTHSLFILIPIYYYTNSIPFTCAWLLHQICDWFTHTGRFSARPFFPFPYQIKFGRNILK